VFTVQREQTSLYPCRTKPRGRSKVRTHPAHADARTVDPPHTGFRGTIDLEPHFSIYSGQLLHPALDISAVHETTVGDQYGLYRFRYIDQLTS